MCHYDQLTGGAGMEPKAPWKFGKGLLPELPPSTQVLDCHNETICPVRPRPCFQTPAIPIECRLYAATSIHTLSSPHLLAPQWQRSHPSQSRSYLKAQGHPGLEEGGRGIIVHTFSVCFAIFGSLGQPGCLLCPHAQARYPVFSYFRPSPWALPQG